MTRVPGRSIVCSAALAVLVVSACSSKSPSGDDGPDSAAGSSGALAGLGGMPSSTAGAAAGTAGAAGVSSGSAGAAGAAGPAGGASGASGTASAAGGSGASAGAAGASAGAGAGGASTAGTPGAEAGTGGSTAADDPRKPATSVMLPIKVEPAGKEPWFNIYRPSDPSALEQPMPVIVWANGGCLRVDFAWATLLERWAAAGFVVLALTESPTGGLFGQTTSQHQGELIDWALEAAASGPLAGKLDTERIVAAGNSCGGVTALGLTAVDERVAAVFVLSGSSAIGAADAKVMGAIDVPVGFVVGSDQEDIANPNANMDYALLRDGVPGMLVTRSTGDHFTVSSDAAVLKEVAEIALNWLDLALYGTKPALDALTSPNVCATCSAGTWSLKSKHLEKLGAP